MAGAAPLRISFLGPAGTYTEQAALLYSPNAILLPYTSPAAIAQAILDGATDEGVAAIENSLEGAITETLDVLIRNPQLRIKREIAIPIEHFLLAKPGVTADEVEVVYSHPQALGQCRRYLERHLPHARAVAALSTAAAVEQAVNLGRSAAIGNRRAGEFYGAAVLAERIQDGSNNVTRFVVLALSDAPPTGDDKTSICFRYADDRPGILVEALHALAKRGINLAKIESRPSGESLGRYIFLVDMNGHRLDPPVAAALDDIRAQSDPEGFRVFGSYPRFPLARPANGGRASGTTTA